MREVRSDVSRSNHEGGHFIEKNWVALIDVVCLMVSLPRKRVIKTNNSCISRTVSHMLNEEALERMVARQYEEKKHLP